MSKPFAALIAVAMSLCVPGHAVAQTAQGLAAADRLIAVVGFESQMQDVASKVAPTIPGATEGQKQAFIAEMTAPAFMERYKAQMRAVYAKHLTIEELNALSDFYSKPVAASAMKKMGAAAADTMTFLQTEMPSMIERIMKAK